MLKELYIENLAVIEKANIQFSEHLNVFTGETGAGKSIMINGINAILGQRVTKDIVRTGTDKAVVSAEFVKLDENVMSKLDELGISCEDGSLFLEREIRSDGGSTARVNSKSVNVSVLRELGSLLVNIHGQHDNQILMSPEKHLQILDGYAESDDLIADYRKSFKELQSLARTINKMKIEANQKAFRISRLKEIINEIEAVDISEDEDKQIEQELEIAKNAVVLTETIYNALTCLRGTDDDDGASELTDRAKNQLENYSDVYADFEPLSKRLTDAQIELEDIAEELSAMVDKLDADPRKYEFLSQRNDDINKIKRKYGPELKDVFDTLEKSKAELEQLENSEESLAELKQKQSELLAVVSKKAKKLSEYRAGAGERFISQVTEELEFLNMPNVRLAVSQKTGKLTVNGMDSIEFLISANKGEEPKPIAKIASGGELSRIMLALKNVIADKDSIDTLIFDEIDTGVSGKAAHKIGLKLRQISKIRQVICVTHLSQIAVMGDNHLLIEKNVEGERTVTRVKKLNFEERVYEIARIMGGDDISPLMLKNAEEILKLHMD
ncbi:MAG: DNA repair protein RecN [Oscillospiraceae bacterium]